jgi:hypothetical protein
VTLDIDLIRRQATHRRSTEGIIEIALPFNGADFRATEPYSSGGGNPVILNRTPGETEIGLAFPSGIAIRLFVGPDFRILREEATTPNHLITSTFEYPPNGR